MSHSISFTQFPGSLGKAGCYKGFFALNKSITHILHTLWSKYWACRLRAWPWCKMEKEKLFKFEKRKLWSFLVCSEFLNQHTHMFGVSEMDSAIFLQKCNSAAHISKDGMKCTEIKAISVSLELPIRGKRGEAIKLLWAFEIKFYLLKFMK